MADRQDASEGNTDFGLGARLRAERQRLGWSQEGLAARLGKTQPEIARWEKGTFRPNRSNLERLAAAGFDPTPLGLAGFSTEKIETDLSAARDETLLLSKPRLASQLIRPVSSWLEDSFGSNLGIVQQGDLRLLAESRYVQALLATLLTPTTTRDEPIARLVATGEVTRLIDLQSTRVDLSSRTELLVGNEHRKAGYLRSAADHLERASRLASGANLWRRAAEALGLLSYAKAEMKDKQGFKTALERSRAALSMASEHETQHGVEDEQTVFHTAALNEIRLRCEMTNGNITAVRSLTRDPRIPDQTGHWQTYYLCTLGLACVYVGTPDALHWFERARISALRHSQVSQLDRLSRTPFPRSREWDDMKRSLQADIKRIGSGS